MSYDFWEKNLRANQYILDVIINGYKLPINILPESYKAQRKNLSALRNGIFMEETIKGLLAGSFIVERNKPLFCIDPLRVAENEKN